MQDAFAEQQQESQALMSQGGPPATKGVAKLARTVSNDPFSTAGNSSTADGSTGSHRGKGTTTGSDAVESGVGAQMEGLRSKAADALRSDGSDVASPAELQYPLVTYAVNEVAEAQEAVCNADGDGGDARRLSSRSIDGDSDGMLDRFGSVDIITGRPVRDLKLDPVLQLVKWRESLFGSKDSVSESLDDNME